MLFDPAKLLLLAGPCSLENEKVCRAVAEKLVAVQRALPQLRIVFKGSYDKANRTSIEGPRGTGMEEGLALLDLVRRDYGFPILTDVHESTQVPGVAAVVDVVQIPAFLCRQTDLLVACAASGRTINVKKGQFLAPQDMKNVCAQLKGPREIWQTSRCRMKSSSKPTMRRLSAWNGATPFARAGVSGNDRQRRNACQSVSP